MKKLIFGFVLVLMFFGLNAQTEKQFFDLMIQGDYNKAEVYFGDMIDVCIGDYEDMLMKREAMTRVKRFFNNKKPQTYSIKHHGKSKGGQSTYYVSELNTNEGLYRFFVYFEKDNNKSTISELRLEKN